MLDPNVKTEETTETDAAQPEAPAEAEAAAE